jgi:hypothetical protein
MTAAPPLLVLAAGGRPRLRRARMPVPKESRLHKHVADLLDAHCLPDWRWTHINRKCKDAREGAIMKRMGVKRGWFDFELISPEPRPHFLDPKRLGEEPTEEQLDFKAWCDRVGCPAVFVWRMDEVLRTFDAWGCLRVEYVPRRDSSTFGGTRSRQIRSASNGTIKPP